MRGHGGGAGRLSTGASCPRLRMCSHSPETRTPRVIIVKGAQGLRRGHRRAQGRGPLGGAPPPAGAPSSGERKPGPPGHPAAGRQRWAPSSRPRLPSEAA